MGTEANLGNSICSASQRYVLKMVSECYMCIGMSAEGRIPAVKVFPSPCAAWGSTQDRCNSMRHDGFSPILDSPNSLKKILHYHVLHYKLKFSQLFSILQFENDTRSLLDASNLHPYGN